MTPTELHEELASIGITEGVRLEIVKKVGEVLIAPTPSMEPVEETTPEEPIPEPIPTAKELTPPVSEAPKTPSTPSWLVVDAKQQTPIPPPQAVNTEPAAPRPTEAVPPPIPKITAEEPHVRTMASDVEAMQGSEKREVVKTPQIKPVVELPQVDTPPPPQNQPPVRTSTVSTVHEDLKKYGVDPYREPIG